MQKQLFFKTKRAFKIKTLDAFNSSNIRSHYANHKNETKKTLDSIYSYPRFKIQITQDNFSSLNKYPYLDTFRFFKYTSNNLVSCDEGESEIQFDQTNGDYNDNANQEYCEYSGEYYHQDDCCWSEMDGCYYYEENCRYVEERQDYVSIDYAIYNEYTGDYHYKDDLNF